MIRARFLGGLAKCFGGKPLKNVNRVQANEAAGFANEREREENRRLSRESHWVALRGHRGDADSHIAGGTESGPFLPFANRAGCSVDEPHDPLGLFRRSPG